MKQGMLALSLALLLSACTPGLSPDIGGAAERAANRAVETAVESAVDTLVQRTVDRLVNQLFDTLIASAIDGVFGVNGSVEYGPDFALELYTGRYDITLAGDESGSYSFSGGEPEEDTETFNVGVGLRLQNDEGQEITSVSLVYADEAEGFGLSLLEGQDESGAPVWRVGLQFDDRDVTYLGEATVNMREVSGTRYAASFTADLLAYEAGVDPVNATPLNESVSVSATFDVPINPAGSLFFRQAQVAQGE